MMSENVPGTSSCAAAAAAVQIEIYYTFLHARSCQLLVDCVEILCLVAPEFNLDRRTDVIPCLEL